MTTGLPDWVQQPIAWAKSSLADKGYQVSEDALLRRLLKRTLSRRGVEAAMAEVETDIIAERKQSREEEARRLEEQAAEIRRGE